MKFLNQQESFQIEEHQSYITGGHQRNYREIPLTLICSFVTSGTFGGSGIFTEKPNKGRYSRLFRIFYKRMS